MAHRALIIFKELFFLSDVFVKLLSFADFFFKLN